MLLVDGDLVLKVKKRVYITRLQKSEQKRTEKYNRKFEKNLPENINLCWCKKLKN